MQNKTLHLILKNRLLFTTLLVFIGFSSPATAAISKIHSVEGITEYRLDNGLQLLLFPDASKDTITVNITYRVGSKHENYGETGMAHLLEHLLFKGTPKYPNITKELSDHGAQANGTTWLERTNYYATFKATDENLQWALDLESDRMVNSFVAQKDLDSEMTVVRNEFERGENNPTLILVQRIQATAYAWHNYGNSTIGARSDIENVKIENLKAFYKKYYQPDNATLIVAGKIDVDKTLRWVDQYFGSIPKPRRVLPEFYTRDPVQDGERSVVLRRVGDEQIVATAYHIPSGIHPDFPAISVLAQILGDTPSGRLHKNLVETKLATRIGAWPNQQKEPSLLFLYAQADLDTDLAKTKQILLESLETINNTAITKNEVERAKRQLIKQIELSFNSSQSISIALSNWIGMGDWRMFFLNRDRIEQITIADVQGVAEKYLIPSNRTLGEFVPTKNPVRAVIPDTPDLAGLLDGYQGRSAIEQGEVFEYTPETIEQRLQRHEQSNIKLALMPIKTRGNSVFINLQFHMGDEKKLMHMNSVGKLTGAMLKRGSSRLNREEIQDEFDKLKSRGSIGGGADKASASYETTRENLAQLIQLLHELFTTPAFPEDEFELLKSQNIASLESQKSDPQQLALRRLYRSFNHHPKGHLLYARTIDETISDVSKVKLKDLKRFYKKFYGASNMEIAVVGDFDVAATKQQLLDLFGDWQSRQTFSPIVDQFTAADKVAESINTPDKKNAVFLAAINFAMTSNHPDAQAMQLVAYMLGGGLLNSRLANRIREQDGLSYGVGAGVSLHPMDNNALFRAYAISAPENVEKVHAAFNEEMLKAWQDGFAEQELSDAKKGFLDSRKVGMSDNKNLASRLKRDLYFNRTMAWEIKFIQAIQKLTLDDVNRTMKKYLHPDNMIIVKAGDFKNKAQ